jgi:preprotein translocase subunit SecA
VDYILLEQKEMILDELIINLSGRCGRQGDPGTSRFFLSLDDNLLRLFGGPKIQNFMQTQIPR